VVDRLLAPEKPARRGVEREQQASGRSFADENTTEEAARAEYRAIAERHGTPTLARALCRLAILQPHLRRDDHKAKHKVVIGVVEGDTHDIGKNLVKVMLETAGFAVVDLGRDVAPAVFVERAMAAGAHLIGLSTLMTTTMGAMSEVIRLLDERRARPRIKVMVGGGPVSQQFANRIGADGYAANASGAVAVATRLRQASLESVAP